MHRMREIRRNSFVVVKTGDVTECRINSRDHREAIVKALITCTCRRLRIATQVETPTQFGSAARAIQLNAPPPLSHSSSRAAPMLSSSFGNPLRSCSCLFPSSSIRSSFPSNTRFRFPDRQLVSYWQTIFIMLSIAFGSVCIRVGYLG